MPACKPKPNEKPQRERFIETAREIGADETPEAFDRAFNRVIKATGHEVNIPHSDNRSDNASKKSRV